MVPAYAGSIPVGHPVLIPGSSNGRTWVFDAHCGGSSPSPGTGSWCIRIWMSPYQHLKAWRKRLKSILVSSFGGSCGTCGYKTCVEALEFHHLSPETKDLSISSWTTVSSFQGLRREAEKCVMLCSNCHREFHAGVRQIPYDIRRFDGNIFDLARSEAIALKRIAATERLSKTRRKRGSWEGVDVVELRRSGSSWAAIGRAAGVGYGAARNRYERLTGM